MNISRRNFLSAIFGAGLILPTSGSLLNCNIFDHLRYAWNSLEIKEMASACPIRNHAVSSRDEDSYRILTHTDNNEDVLRLNTIAAHIWELCNGENSVDGMVRKITSAFDVEQATCRRDIILVLMNFKRKGLIFLS